MKKIDLHVHTNASDGDFSPKELIDHAIKNKIKAIAITDHDSITSVKEAMEYSKNKDLEVIPGVEISCNQERFFDIHILGFFIDYNDANLKSLLEAQKQRRIQNKKDIIKKLNKFGYDINFEEVKKHVGDSLGRPHIAKVLVEKHNFSSIKQVFDELLDNKAKAYVEPERVSFKQAIDTIKKCKGIAVLAHPYLYDEPEKVIKLFIKLGGQGIEIDYPYKKALNLDEDACKKIFNNLKKIAKDKNLLITGGSDYHGPSRHYELGECGLTQEEFEIFKKKS
jgi:predicted metal-dependent phosphoesterase TrpH